MMSTYREISRLLLLMCTMTVGGTLWAGEAEIPVPPGIQALPEPYEVNLGSTPLEIQGFTTSMSAEELRAFYTKALPKAGWGIEPLPWQAQQARVSQDFKQVMGRNREARRDPQMQTMQDRLERADRELANQLYARHGDRQLILNFTTVGDRRAVFINQWNGRASWMEMRPSEAVTAEETASKTGAWPMTNVCCSGDSVAEQDVRRVLPTTVPPYPGARVAATDRSASGDTRIVVMETPDDREKVAKFYEQQLAYNGWKHRSDFQEAPGSDMALYEKEQVTCGVILGSAPTAEEGTNGPATVITIHVMDESVTSATR